MKLLLVEDEHPIANSIKKGLEQETYAVDIAYSGTDGYDLASTEEYDLIILDLMLPGMSGLEICDRLREKGVHTPILILTAKGQVEDKVKGLGSGADDYLTKPFAFDELLARVKAISRRPQRISPVVLKVADLTLDTEHYEVRRGNDEIQLSGKEFALLEYMMRNKGKILSKEQIISHVWNYDSDVLPNTVEVYVGYLRNKVDKPYHENKPLIQTFRGFGYKMG